jgi:hypothetical protein
MKPRMFIGSSVEQLDLAYAAQDNLEHDVEGTVWTQGIFGLSRSSLASLIDVLDESDFGLFIFAPDDVTTIRDATKRTVRDNVVFELGLFIGRLGSERCFTMVPRGTEDLHLPTDLIGMAPAEFASDRSDGNLQAALGPACNRVRKAVKALAVNQRDSTTDESLAAQMPDQTQLFCSSGDCLALLESYVSKQSIGAPIQYAAADKELKMAPWFCKNLYRASCQQVEPDGFPKRGKHDQLQEETTSAVISSVCHDDVNTWHSRRMHRLSALAH